MGNWEYKLVRLGDALPTVQGELDNAGNEGWELVAVVNQPMLGTANLDAANWAYFKKPVAGDPPIRRHGVSLASEG